MDLQALHEKIHSKHSKMVIIINSMNNTIRMVEIKLRNWVTTTKTITAAPHSATLTFGMY